MRATAYDRILRTAVRMAKSQNYVLLSSVEIAKRAKCSTALVFHYFSTIEGLRNEIVAAGIELGIEKIIADAAMMRHPLVMRLPAARRAWAMRAAYSIN